RGRVYSHACAGGAREKELWRSRFSGVGSGWGKLPRMTPSAVGTLADTPLAHALIYASTRRLTGRLELTAPDGRFAAISLWRGTITAVETVPVGATPGGFFGAI